MQAAAKSYFQTQVSTTTQGDLLINLFDAALKFLTQAKEKIAEKKYAEKGILLSKALDILSELQGSLNAQKGGDLADRLQKLYFFCSTRLLAANLKMDVTKIDEVMHILTGLRDAFNEANSQVPTKTVPTSAAQSAPRLSTALSAQQAPRLSGTMPAQALYLAQSGLAAAAANKAPKAVAAPVASAAPAVPAAPAVTSLLADAAMPARAVGQSEEPAEPHPTAAVPPLRRAMAAYAAGRAQG